MTTYLSTFITGFGDIVESAIRKNVKDAQINLLLDGLIIFQSKANINQIRQLNFLNNSFIVLAHNTKTSADPLQDILLQALKQTNVEKQFLAAMPHRPTSFRVKTFRENQPVAVDKTLLSKLEKQLSQIHYLHLNKSTPQIEFWCFTRREGHAFFALKITRTENYEKTLSKGELRPELANLLCLLSEPKSTDIFLDPFAGFGSIPAARAKLLPAAKIIAGDNNPNLIKTLQAKFKSIKHPITITKLDALSTPFESQSITKIVTDPPWGFFEKDLNINQLYQDMLTEFTRILKPNGIAIILTAQKETFTNVLQNHPSLSLISEHTTLVSGKKASAYKLRLVDRRSLIVDR